MRTVAVILCYCDYIKREIVGEGIYRVNFSVVRNVVLELNTSPTTSIRINDGSYSFLIKHEKVVYKDFY